MGTTQTLPLPILPVDAVIELEGLDNCDDQLHLRSPLTANVLVNRIRSKKVLLENASSSRARTRKRPPRSTGQAKSRSSAAASPSSPLPEGDTRRADGDPRYEGIDPSLVPAIECLADVVERTHLCYSAEILPNLQATGVSGGAALSSPTATRCVGSQALGQDLRRRHLQLGDPHRHPVSLSLERRVLNQRIWALGRSRSRSRNCYARRSTSWRALDVGPSRGEDCGAICSELSKYNVRRRTATTTTTAPPATALTTSATLAATGSDLASPLSATATLLGLGGLGVLGAQRRRRHREAAL